jgi:hypothetical protein
MNEKVIQGKAWMYRFVCAKRGRLHPLLTAGVRVLDFALIKTQTKVLELARLPTSTSNHLVES